MSIYWRTLQFGFAILFSRTTLADIIVISGNVTIARFKDMPSTFGPDVPDDGIDGYLILADPIYACTAVEKPPIPPINETDPLSWILLIKRGVCDFDTKVENAQNSGYLAAIVFDNNTSKNLIPMSGKDGTSRIPSVFVSYSDGMYLQTQFLFPTPGYYIRITPGYMPFSLNAILLPFAIVVGICFVVLSLVLVVKYIKDRRRRQRHRLPKSQLKKLALKKYKKGEGNDVCAICLEEFDEGDKLRVLPCHHQYHVKCVDPWLLNNKRICPVCKRKVIPGDDSDDEGSTGPGSSEPSEHTPLLAPQNLAPLDNDMPVQQPPLLINVDYASDEEYDADTETHQNQGLVPEDICSSPQSSSPSFNEEPDVPLIRLNDSDDVPQRHG